MIDLIIFLLASFGLMNAIVYESVFYKVRQWIDKTFKYSILNKIIKCGTCTSFYTGMLCSFLLPMDYNLINIIVCGLISSAINKLIIIKFFKL